MILNGFLILYNNAFILCSVMLWIICVWNYEWRLKFEYSDIAEDRWLSERWSYEHGSAALDRSLVAHQQIPVCNLGCLACDAMTDAASFRIKWRPDRCV